MLVEHYGANAEATGSNPVEAPKNVFSGFFAIALIAIHCDGHILISFVFPQFTSFHSEYLNGGWKGQCHVPLSL